VTITKLYAPTDNVWSITVIQRADGSTTISPVNCPKELEAAVIALMRQKLKREPQPT